MNSGDAKSTETIPSWEADPISRALVAELGAMVVLVTNSSAPLVSLRVPLAGIVRLPPLMTNELMAVVPVAE